MSSYKIDWTAKDYMNYEDMIQLKQNIQSIWDKCYVLYYLPQTTARNIVQLSGVRAIPYTYLINNLEQNLRDLIDTMGVDFITGTETKWWYSRTDSNNTGNPNYEDWTRWNLLLLSMSEALNYSSNYAYGTPSGTFRAGNFKTLQHYSRGR